MTGWTDKLTDLLTFLTNLVNCKFTGSVEIHFNNGNVSRINKLERIK